MKIVVPDSNIIFSALRSSNSPIRETLRRADCQFFAPNFLFAEIFKHKEKLLLHAKASEAEVFEYLVRVLHRVHFVNDEVVSLPNRIHAFRLCNSIDEKDTPFVALALELDAALWTKDEVLKSGLLKKGFDKFFSPKI